MYDVLDVIGKQVILNNDIYIIILDKCFLNIIVAKMLLNDINPYARNDEFSYIELFVSIFE